jgi:hypothetical protein
MGVYSIAIAACLVLSGGTLNSPPTPGVPRDKPAEAADSSSTVTPAKGTTHALRGPRVLHFPADRSLGKVMIQPVGSGETAETFDCWIYGPKWEFIGQAQGDVAIPAGHEVSLSVWRPEGWRDLTPLLQLAPDDLYQLGIHGPDTGGPRPGDSCMSYVSRLTGLRILSLLHTNVGPAGMQHVAGLKRLQYLVLPNRIDEKGVAPVAALTSLVGLPFGDNNVTDTTLEHLAGLDSLTVLELGGQKLTGVGVGCLAGLPSLRRITFCGRTFSGSAFACLKDLKGLEALRFKDLEQIGEIDLGHLSRIPRLEDLDLFPCMNLTDAGPASLKRLSRLRRLNIAHARLTDEGLASLKEMKCLEALHPPLMVATDGGLVCLGELPRLRKLMLSGRFTDKALEHLQKLPNLESLYFKSGANFSPRALNQFRRNMPRLVHYDNLQQPLLQVRPSTPPRPQRR